MFILTHLIVALLLWKPNQLFVIVSILPDVFILPKLKWSTPFLKIAEKSSHNVIFATLVCLLNVSVGLGLLLHLFLDSTVHPYNHFYYPFKNPFYSKRLEKCTLSYWWIYRIKHEEYTI